MDAIVKQEGSVLKGNCILKFKIYDPIDDKMFVDLPSKKYRINPDNEMIDSLRQLAELEY